MKVNQLHHFLRLSFYLTCWPQFNRSEICLKPWSCSFGVLTHDTWTSALVESSDARGILLTQNVRLSLISLDLFENIKTFLNVIFKPLLFLVFQILAIWSEVIGTSVWQHLYLFKSCAFSHGVFNRNAQIFLFGCCILLSENSPCRAIFKSVCTWLLTSRSFLIRLVELLSFSVRPLLWVQFHFHLLRVYDESLICMQIFAWSLPGFIAQISSFRLALLAPQSGRLFRISYLGNFGFEAFLWVHGAGLWISSRSFFTWRLV